MNGYHQSGVRQSGVRRQRECGSGNYAYALGESLGSLFQTAAQVVGGGVRMALSYGRRGCGGECRGCAPRYCDCVECRPAIYTGCCRNCGE